MFGLLRGAESAVNLIGLLAGASLLIYFLMWFNNQAYERGMNDCKLATIEATDMLNAALKAKDQAREKAAEEHREEIEKYEDLERQLRAEREAADDDSGWSIDRVRRYNRAGRPDAD